MSRDDLMQSLGIVLANEPASMDAYNIFRNLNQTSKSTRAVVQYALQDESWTRKYFERAHAFEKTIEDRIAVDTLDGIVREL
jgi:ABC-type phosphate/phosphonate transport system ATPase subunit